MSERHRAAPGEAVETRPDPTQEDPFYYGHRVVVHHAENGTESYEYVPLSPDDFLDPQEGDYFVEGTLHHTDVRQVESIFVQRYAEDPDITVFGNLKMVWGIEGLSEPAPDVVVVPNVREPEQPRGEFDVQAEGTRPRFVLELVSPRYVPQDLVAKPAIYERAGVEEYFILDSGLRRWRDAVRYTVTGYRLVGGRYVEVEPDERGWLYSQVTGVWIGVTPERDGYLLVDGHTGERLLPAEERVQAAEQQAQAEAISRAEAEQRAQAEPAARADAEQQIQEMAAEIARLRARLEGKSSG